MTAGAATVPRATANTAYYLTPKDIEVPECASGHGLAPTAHAWQRMSGRGISRDAIDAALAWGRISHERLGATSHFIGWRQVARAAREGVDIADLEGLVVIMASDSGVVITAYRNRSRRMRRR